MDMKKKAKSLMFEIRGFFIKGDALKEAIDDAMANQLEKLNKNSTVQDGEKALLKAGLKAGVTFIQTQSGQNVPLTDEQYEQIAIAIMNAKNKFMPKVIAQLRKK